MLDLYFQLIVFYLIFVNSKSVIFLFLVLPVNNQLSQLVKFRHFDSLKITLSVFIQSANYHISNYFFNNFNLYPTFFNFYKKEIITNLIKFILLSCMSLILVSENLFILKFKELFCLLTRSYQRLVYFFLS